MSAASPDVKSLRTSGVTRTQVLGGPVSFDAVGVDVLLEDPVLDAGVAGDLCGNARGADDFVLVVCLAFDGKVDPGEARGEVGLVGGRGPEGVDVYLRGIGDKCDCCGIREENARLGEFDAFLQDFLDEENGCVL